MSAVDAPLTNGAAQTNGNGSAQPDAPAETVIPFEPSVFRSYLLMLVPPFLGAVPEELETLFDDDFDERVTKFAQEGGGTMYVVKRKDDSEGEFNAATGYARRFDA